MLYERFDREQGRKWLDEAILTIDNLTDAEKYSILSFYAINIEKDFDKGMDYTKTIIELYPDDPRAYNNLGYYYQQQGQYEKAIAVFEDILHRSPGDAVVRYNLGVNYSLLGDFENARNHFLEFKKPAEYWLDVYPENPSSFIVNGLVMTQLGEKDTGWEMGEKALELDSTIHFQMTELLAVQDRKCEALDHLEKALENGYRDLAWLKLNPNFYQLHEEARYQELIKKYFN